MAPMEAAAVPQMQGGRGQGGRGEGRGRGRGDSRGGGRGSGFVSPHEGSPGSPAPSQPSPPSSVPIPTESLEKMQIAEKRQESVSAALQKLGDKHSGFKIPLRKSTGTQAICRFTVETNHLPLKINIKEIIHYDVDIQPDKPKKLMRPVMEAVQRLCYPNKHPAFDGRKNLYSAGTLEFGTEMSTTVTIRDAERAQDLEFKVNIKFAARINMSSLQDYMTAGKSTEMPQRQIQAVDVILRSAPALRFVPVGRSYFTPPRGGIGVDLTGGMELWFGFYQSAILGWKPFVNVDVAHKGFPKAQNCVNLMRELIPNLQPNAVLSPRDVDTLSKYIKGLKVNYEIPKIPNTKRTYKVNAVVEPANQSRFDHDGKIMTVEEYYRDFKGYKLMYPNFPLLHLGSLQKKMYMPIELCSVSPGQAIMRKLNEGQTTKMIREAATPAYRRKQKIEDALNQVGFQNDRTLLEFGISVGRQFESVQARILDSPVIKYNKDTVKPRQGVWNVSQFEKGTSLTSWAILNLDRYVREDQVDEFIKQISIATRKLGMQFAPPVKRSCDTQRDRRPESWLDFARGQQFQIVVVIVSQFPGQYAKVKQTAELKMGLLTQCVKGSTIQRLKPATTSNILLKMNSKLNGVNHVLSARPRCFAEPIMVVGADVTHPSPDAVDIPSAAAVAASIDANAFRYAIKYRLQPPRVEPIEDLQNIMKELLLVFYRTNNGVKPKKIVVFRDGVSDGQFSIVLNSELMAIRRACSSLEPDYKPKITFLVVQKRHHTRFFPGRDLPPQFVDQRNGNVPAGTIVDTNITHPTELDFYLVSHASLQGTSRPTKYHLLWDDNDFSTDELEALTYHLCHMFSRCTRSVSYPAPTYYAHLAAFRARVYMEDARINMRDLAREQSVRTLNQTFEKNWPMFFV